MIIRRLDPDTIGKIAAGEVVERPAAAVKELLENAIDAGATRIQVEIEGAGLESIQVHDNGTGIEPDDLELLLTRHSTSKLSSFEDLHELATLGFRGEALASIASVSEITIRSRTTERQAGVERSAQFGSIGSVTPVASPVGTRISVRQLFANVPARRKFLRRPATEAGAIQRTVEAYALAYPHVALSLQTEGRTAFRTSGSGDLVQTVADVLGPDVGRAVSPIPVLEDALQVPGVAVSGWVASPDVSRSHRQGIVLFVNGRWIQSRPISYALEEAYHTLLMVGRHPVALARIEIDPAELDVNVHPTKSKIRFTDERLVARAVSRSVHSALSGLPRTPIPGVTFSAPEQGQPMLQLDEPVRRAVREPAESGEAIDTADRPAERGMPALRVLGQVASTYIIAEGPEGLYLIDQHAAHERVVYERILAELATRRFAQQPLLDPLVIELEPDEMGLVERSLDEFQTIGFDIEPFGEGSVVVRAVPVVAAGVDIASRFRAILAELAEGGMGASWLDSVAVSVACHTSIRAGQTLSLPEMRELIEQLERTDQPRACGHGRPTMLKMTQTDLERSFSRT